MRGNTTAHALNDLVFIFLITFTSDLWLIEGPEVRELGPARFTPLGQDEPREDADCDKEMERGHWVCGVVVETGRIVRNFSHSPIC